MNMKKNNRLKSITPYVILIVVIGIILLVLRFQNGTVHNLTTGELLNEISSNNVTEITITPKSSESVYYIEGRLSNYKKTETFKAKVVEGDLTSKIITVSNDDLYEV